MFLALKSVYMNMIKNAASSCMWVCPARCTQDINEASHYMIREGTHGSASVQHSERTFGLLQMQASTNSRQIEERPVSSNVDVTRKEAAIVSENALREVRSKGESADQQTLSQKRKGDHRVRSRPAENLKRVDRMTSGRLYKVTEEEHKSYAAEVEEIDTLIKKAQVIRMEQTAMEGVKEPTAMERVKESTDEADGDQFDKSSLYLVRRGCILFYITLHLHLSGCNEVSVRTADSRGWDGFAGIHDRSSH